MSIDSGSFPELLKIADVAALLNISVPSVRRLQRQRQIPFHKVRGCIRFAKSDVAAYLRKQRIRTID